MASAGSYESLYLAPERPPHQHPTTQFYMLDAFLLPNKQCQNTEGKALKGISLTRMSKFDVIT